MKNLVYILSFFVAVCSYAQANEKEVSVVEERPEFPGGDESLAMYFQSEIVYPMEAKSNGIVGRVYTKYVVDSTGKVISARVMVSSGDSSLDKEAIRVLTDMPRWKPGTRNGKAVNTSFKIPISFSVDKLLAKKLKKDSAIGKEYYDKGIKKISKNDFNKAKKYLELAVKFNPIDEKAYFELAALYTKMNLFSDACKEYKFIREFFRLNSKEQIETLINKNCKN